LNQATGNIYQTYISQPCLTGAITFLKTSKYKTLCNHGQEYSTALS